MGESRAQQGDFIRHEDDLAALRRWAREAADRWGFDQLANAVSLDPSTLRNQFRWRSRPEGGCWQPNADAIFELLLAGPRLLEQAASLHGMVLSKPPDLDPESALREIAARALGGWDKRALAEVTEVMARTSFAPERDWRRLARAAGWKAPGEDQNR